MVVYVCVKVCVWVVYVCVKVCCAVEVCVWVVYVCVKVCCAVEVCVWVVYVCKVSSLHTEEECFQPLEAVDFLGSSS